MENKEYFIIRPFKTEDVVEVRGIMEKSGLDPWSIESLEEVGSPVSLTQGFCAEMDNKVIGFVIYWIMFDDTQIFDVAVAEEYRRQGVATALIEAVRKKAWESGASRLLLEVRQSNEGARSFYKLFGFVEQGISKNHYSFPREDAILMEKIIV